MTTMSETIGLELNYIIGKNIIIGERINSLHVGSGVGAYVGYAVE